MTQQEHTPKPPPEEQPRVTAHSIMRHIFNIHEDMAEPAEIRSHILDGGRLTGTNACILFCAILIASAGLISNSTAVVIGAMLVSPIMGSILGLAYGTVTGDKNILKRQGIGFAIQILISIITSTLFFLLIPEKEPTSELLARTAPDYYDVIIAFFGGIAGIIGNTRKNKANNVVPGVAIATALMPPLCTCGYSIANGKWQMLYGAAYLFLLNCYFIYSSAELILSVINLPEAIRLSRKERKQYRFRKRIITLIVMTPCILLLVTRLISRF